MSKTPKSKWHALRADDLHVLRPVFGTGVALDPLLRWWDLSRPRARPHPPHLAVLVKQDESFSTEYLDAAGLLALLQAHAKVQMGFEWVPPRASGKPARQQDLAPRDLPESAKSPVLLGLIDDGCAFINSSFWNAAASASRVQWLWDQEGEPDGRSWRRDPRFNHGRHLSAQGFSEAWQLAHRQGEAAAYQWLDYLCDAGGHVVAASHGTHIASLAAGRIRHLLAPEWGERNPPSTLDAASHAPIAVVTLPRAAIKDTSGRSLCVHVLSGIRFIMAQAGPEQRVVVNLSLGIHGGPHDGSSLLEQALAAEVKAAQGRLVVVTGAGNAYRSEIHAQADGTSARPALKPGQMCELQWEVAPDDPTDSFLELWSSGGLQAQVCTPQGDFSDWVEVGQQQVLKMQGQVLACLSNSANVPNGQGHLVHLALGATQCQAAQARPAYGLWTLRLRNVDQRPVRFDAWTDRDDAPFGDLAGRRYPPRFLDLPQTVSAARLVDRARTQSGLADSASMLVTAAATVYQAQLSRYSASGDGRNGVLRRPFVAMPADESAWRQGLPAAGVISGQPQRLNGTSVATALLSREVLNLLAERSFPDLASLQAALAPRLFPGGPLPLPPGDLRAGLGLGQSSLCRV